MWDMPSWKAPPKDQGFSGDVKSDSSSEVKAVDQSSRVGSEGRSSREGDQTGVMGMGMGMESSPAPAPAPAVVSA